MESKDKSYHTIWLADSDPSAIYVIDQRVLPHEIKIQELKTYEDVAFAIREMVVRGAPLIGITAAYGMYLGALHGPKDADAFETHIKKVAETLRKTRPTAVNLHWAIEKQLDAIRRGYTSEEKTKIALENANLLAAEDEKVCRKIGEHGLAIIQEIYDRKGGPVNILTHCNAGRLCCVDWGTATAPIYMAQLAGIPVHVWVSETRPRNQGFSLTAWELNERGVSHTLVVDNACGHIMQHGMVDMVIVGTDRTTRKGDVANKIGTYLKAVAAADNDIPFYVAVPSSSIDWNMEDGLKEIPIEERDENEVKFVQGLAKGKIHEIQVAPENSSAVNYGFDVTPARLITGLITEYGICKASEEGLVRLFPEKKREMV